jgi:hypothetical protein
LDAKVELAAVGRAEGTLGAAGAATESGRLDSGGAALGFVISELMRWKSDRSLASFGATTLRVGAMHSYLLVSGEVPFTFHPCC